MQGEVDATKARKGPCSILKTRGTEKGRSTVRDGRVQGAALAFDHVHRLSRGQRNLQTHSKSALVRLSACHANIQGGKKAGKVLNRAGHGKPIRVGCRRLIEEEIELRADR